MSKHCIHCDKLLEKELHNYEVTKIGKDPYRYKCPFCGTYFSKEEFDNSKKE